MKILVLSDLHLEFEAFSLDSADADVVVLAGDIHIGDKGAKWAIENIKDLPVIYVLGNHEYYKQIYPKLPRKLKELVAGTNVSVLENESLQIEDVVFHGCTLWTNFELFGNPRVAGFECQQVMTDFRKIRKEPYYSKIRSLDVAMINKASVRWLSKQFEEPNGLKNVVVTHHAPSIRSVPEAYRSDIVSAAYASNLDGLVEELSPNLWVHGHCHENSDYVIGNTRVVCNPRGYPGERNTDYESRFIVDV